MEHLGTWLQGALVAVGAWAYLVLFALVFVETGLLVPVPAETALVLASVLAARGQLSLPLVILVAAVAASVGDFVAYSLGRGPGRARLERNGRFLLFRRSHAELVRRYFERYGAATVFFGRFVSLLRIGAAFVAGMAEMPRRSFFFYNIAGGVVWAVSFGAIGFWFGHSWPTIHRWLGGIGLALVAALGIAGIGLWRWRARRAGRGPAAGADGKVAGDPRRPDGADR